jgi:transcription termination factor NusB
VHYRYASGREGDWFQVGFSPRKRSLTLYLMNGVDGHTEQLERLGKHSTGKGCLYIKRLDDVDREVLRELISEAAVPSP